MTPENFCYWLQGWFELNETIDHREGATPETLKMIQDHLALVFNKVTPNQAERNKEIRDKVIEILNESKRIGGYIPKPDTDDSNIALLNKQKAQLHHPKTSAVTYHDSSGNLVSLDEYPESLRQHNLANPDNPLIC